MTKQKSKPLRTKQDNSPNYLAEMDQRLIESWTASGLTVTVGEQPIPYGSIRGRILPGKGEAAKRSALRIATRFAGRTVPVWEHAPGPISSEQVELQTKIADQYDAALPNNLDDANVKRAYAATSELKRRI